MLVKKTQPILRVFKYEDGEEEYFMKEFFDDEFHLLRNNIISEIEFSFKDVNEKPISFKKNSPPIILDLVVQL